MIKISGKAVAIASVVVACGIAALFVPRGEEVAEEQQTSSAPRSKKQRAAERIAKRKAAIEKKKMVETLQATATEKQPKKGPGKRLREKYRPVINEEEYPNLKEEHRNDLKTIQEALDNDDFPAVIAVTQKMQQSPDWPDKIPVELRKEALNSLSWFGVKSLPEITGFLADSDPEVIEEAVSAYENIMSDANGDRELQQVVLAAALTVNDADAMESILMEVNNMRPSVAVSTLKAVWESGTDAARQALPDAIEFFTGEENIKTPDALDAWYNDPSGDNRDTPDAESEFGPQSV